MSTLQGEYKIVSRRYRYPSPACEARQVYRSAGAEHISMKHLTYGMDVLAYIGYLRFVEHKTRTEIMEILQGKQFINCERQVQKLYERYTILLQADHENDAKETLAQIVEEHGGIILSIDRVQPEKRR